MFYYKYILHFQTNKGSLKYTVFMMVNISFLLLLLLLNKIYNIKLQSNIIKIFKNSYQLRLNHSIIGRVGVVEAAE